MRTTWLHGPLSPYVLREENRNCAAIYEMKILFQQSTRIGRAFAREQRATASDLGFQPTASAAVELS